MTSSKAGGIRRREMTGAVLIGGMGLGGDTNAADDPYGLVDPQMVAPLKALDLPDHYTPQVLEARRNLPLPPPLPSPAPRPVSRTIPGPKGAPDVRVVVVDPQPGAKNRPALLHMHGGGFIVGAAERGLPRLQTIAATHGCVVVSVNYRLAPETPFPGALEDNYAALRWLVGEADALGVDTRRIAVGGESAGAGHAAALCIAARDRGGPALAFQLLIYPMLDDRTGSTRAMPPNVGQFVWKAPANRFGWTALLGAPAGSATVPAGAVPAREANLAGLPPAFIGVGALDLFADEDVEYARRLKAAGVPVETVVVPGAYHGFDGLAPEAAASIRFTQAWNTALARAFRPA